MSRGAECDAHITSYTAVAVTTSVLNAINCSLLL